MECYTDERSVTNGIGTGTVYMDKNVGGLISKFKDNTKIDRVGDSEKGCQRT